MGMPTLRQLQYLTAVVELRHFGQAAERCFVTQSTLSVGIQELEAQLGGKLLERTKRRVLPTPLGLEIANRAREILTLTGDLVDLARSDNEPLSGVLHLGVIPTIGPFLLPKVLPGIRDQFPGLELYLVEDQTAHLLERLEAGTLDAAIIAFPYDIGSMERSLFWDENFWVVFPADHPMAGRNSVFSQELPQDELLMLEEGHCLRDHALAACRLKPKSSNSAFQGTSLYTLLQMVIGGQGITFLPEMAVDSDLMKNSRIKLQPLSEPGPHRQVGMVWRSSYYRKDELRLLALRIGELLSARVNSQ